MDYCMAGDEMRDDALADLDGDGGPNSLSCNANR
jgi:hypothetical protein